MSEDQLQWLTHLSKVSNFKALTEQFTCGNPQIDEFLIERSCDFSRLTNTFLYIQGTDVAKKVIGFFTLQNDSASVTKKYRRSHDFNVGNIQTYPTILITFFAIDRNFQNKKYGWRLMLTIFGLVYENRHALGAYTLLTVEALNEVVPFYEQFGFETYERPNNRAHTFLAITIDEIGEFLNSQQ